MYVCADPSPYLLVVLVPVLKLDDASGQVGVNEEGRHVVKVHSKTHILLSLSFYPLEAFLV